MNGLELALTQYVETVINAIVGLGVVGGIAIGGFALWRARS